ncbi:Homeobox-leucine zipper protein HAT14 [Hibiscus syriacus]|uniref:Homeobox-leucine zipper protein HAT14 n=1 Tax=Hibiscus syriacus TaxID=106335 RepID=A0A6A2Y5Q4_HIBSY|nr:homeobox-leucine zipper protein HAT14-like [Hibiscus syriacus]KAE8676485.1 Homeobox-leucine zipper protein HAT14 [Hibiscus syriacus]
MELALSLGLGFLEKSPQISRSKDLGFCIGLGDARKYGDEKRVPSDSPLLLRFPCLTDNHGDGRGLDVNRLLLAEAEESEEGAAVSSPNSTVSSFQMDFGIRTGSNKGKRDLNSFEAERASDDDDELNGSARKKLRLSKEQSAFLEESFKEHNTLNPKQKLALAKQLNLRPRQVEVWFQNRRARTKLKQTEVDREYLKRCCETLREENKRLQKELLELRALKNSQPFYMNSPATTLTMCPSCERVATAKAQSPAANNRGYPPSLRSTDACDLEPSPRTAAHLIKSLDLDDL